MIYIGKYANTHGLKGEIRIISNFSRKDLVFYVGNMIYIDNKDFEIATYRVHKNYDMVTLKGINNINDIEYLKGKEVFIKDIKESFLIEDITNYKVIIKEEVYNIKEVIENKVYKIIVLEDGRMIPFIDNFIKNIDNENKTIYAGEVEGL